MIHICIETEVQEEQFQEEVGQGVSIAEVKTIGGAEVVARLDM